MSLSTTDEMESLPTWKSELLALCEQSIRELPTPEDSPETVDPSELPSLYEFYAELAVLRNEQRSGNRKLSEVLKDFSAILTDLKDRQGSGPNSTETASSSGNRKQAKAAIDLLDRIDRILVASEAPFTVKTSFFGPASTPTRWTKQQESLQILETHFRPLMDLIGLEYRPVINSSYDPSTMTAVSCPAGADLDKLIVKKELIKGYWWNDQNIRPAEVEVVES